MTAEAQSALLPAARVSRRSVFLIGGYEPKSSDAFFKRTRRELERYCETWELDATMRQEQLSDDGLVATAEIDCRQGSQKVTTEFNFFVWNDIVQRDFSRPTLVRAAKYSWTFFDYLLSGTFFRIVGQAWRFSLYFLYPAVMLALFTTLSVLAGVAIANLPFAGSGLLGGATGLGLLVGMLRYTGRRWFVMHLMDLWSFSSRYLRGKRPDASAHIARFAQAVVERAQSRKDDEIILVGHSTGGGLILDIAATALRQYASLGKNGPSVTILTVGSTALKLGLHPAAGEFRAKVQTLVDAHAIQWVECQALTDIVNFYKTNPVSAMGLTSTRTEEFPRVQLVRIRDMLQPDVYKRFKYNIFRVHYQFIMANTKKCTYDFFMMCCGTKTLQDMLDEPLEDRAQLHEQPAAKAA